LADCGEWEAVSSLTRSTHSGHVLPRAGARRCYNGGDNTVATSTAAASTHYQQRPLATPSSGRWAHTAVRITIDRERRSGHQAIACKGVRSSLGTLLSVGAADSRRGRRTNRTGKAARRTLERGYPGRRTLGRSWPEPPASTTAQKRGNRSVANLRRGPPVHAGGFSFHSFLTRLAQAGGACWCEHLEAVIGPVTDGGFFVRGRDELSGVTTASL
jgi:hypothetical protein